MTQINAILASQLVKNEVSYVATHAMDLEASALAIRLNTLLTALSQEFNLAQQLREIDENTISIVINFIARNPSTLFFMRHGGQQVAKAHENLNSADKKIAMMQQESNARDSITLASTIEFLATLIIFVYIKKQTKTSIDILSSDCPRAAEPAAALAEALETRVDFSDALRCINYPSPQTLEENDLTQYIPGGSLPWKQENVDKIVGEGMYDQISEAMQTLITEKAKQKTSTVVVTHTQQINAVQKTMQPNQKPARLGNYGFIMLASQPKERVSSDEFVSHEMQHGFYCSS